MVCDRLASRDAAGGVKDVVEMPRRCDATCRATFEAGEPARYADAGAAAAIIADITTMLLQDTMEGAILSRHLLWCFAWNVLLTSVP